MKKILAISICMLITFFVAQTAQAQKYVTYESKAFSVLLKCSPDYTKVLEISFSEKGAWVNYKIVKTLPLENKTLLGNDYFVDDAKAQKYMVEYVYEKDKDKFKPSLNCSVVDQKAKTKTPLKKK